MNFEITSEINEKTYIDEIIDNKQGDGNLIIRLINVNIRIFDDSNMINVYYSIALLKDYNKILIARLESYKNGIEEEDDDLMCIFTYGNRDGIELTDANTSIILKGEKADEFVDKLLPILLENRNRYTE